MKKFIFALLLITGLALVCLISWSYYTPTKEKIPIEGTDLNFEIEELDWGYRLLVPPSAPLKVIFDKVSKEADFHVYYPSFVPVGLELDIKHIGWSKSDKITNEMTSYNLGDINSTTTPWVAIVEEKIKQDNENPLLHMIDHAKTRQEILVNGNKAYMGTTLQVEKEFRHLIYSTNDRTALWIRTKDFDFETLIKIAQSMR
jgi:hypothetical protein